MSSTLRLAELDQASPAAARRMLGSPSTELDRFYMQPSQEDQMRFKLTNVRHIFGNQVEEQPTSRRTRTRSIWSTDDESNDSDGSLTDAYPSRDTPVTAPKSESPQKPHTVHAKPVQNSGLERFFVTPSQEEVRRFKLDQVRSLFPLTTSPCFPNKELSAPCGQLSLLTRLSKSANSSRPWLR